VRGGGLAVEGASETEIRPGILTWSDFLKKHSNTSSASRRRSARSSGNCDYYSKGVLPMRADPRRAAAGGHLRNRRPRHSVLREGDGMTAEHHPGRRWLGRSRSSACLSWRWRRGRFT
jgi:hypothetical protein